ncbi:hypothetical protein [Pseudobacteroides cellulosolvens]|uniref:Uncharacterized protein n=1 Tax=Pseudobacteroides cellulosolvens ATCC 35603 = DSM 2933 TaxID=398512 RepID=A0A0L6JVJ0_9FIRM|nr:hypothetical protein [Pseudobacteroides cellulosolvens]KNY29843.1 hypothetical protein Bccel_5120 [Pseudobacteroides cellulosolvens ATCC 35603 = DSM 2933]
MAEKQHAKRINGKLHFSTWAMCNTLGVTQQALSQWATSGCPKIKFLDILQHYAILNIE